MSNCFIIGNGPSLKKVPNSTFERMPSFGSNGILLRFQPTYYVAVNPLAIERFSQLIAECTSPKYLPKQYKTMFSNVTPLNSHGIPLFSYDPLRWVYEGHTVTFVCMQLAFMMGFENVFLLGVDHKYTFVGNPNEEHQAEGDDPNHFDPSYFKDCTWNNPDLAKSEEAYMLAKEAFELDGRKIINCTEGSALTIFEKGELP